MTKSWNELRDKWYLEDPTRRARVEKIKADMEKRINRPWWRFVRWWDEKRGR